MTAVKEMAPPVEASVEVPLATDDGDLQVTFGRTARQLRDQVPDEIPWLVPGFIAPGWTTELNGREKHGKGTLIAYVIGALERGESTVFGPAAPEPVTTLYYTEEPRESVAEKLEAFNVERAFVVYGYELGTLTWPQRYRALVAAASILGHRLLFIDNISRATGTEDESGTELARKVEPLSELAKANGLAVIYDRHQRKSGGRIEDRSRGGTALGGAVEVIVTMDRAESEWGSRSRKLYSVGRVRASNWQRTITLTDDGDDYTAEDAEDFRTRLVREPGAGHIWTAAEFALAIGRTERTARRWLENSSAVEPIEPGDKGVHRWQVLLDDETPDLS